MRRKKRRCAFGAVSLIAFAVRRSPSRPSGRAALRSQVLRIRKSFGLARRFATLLHSPLRGSLSQTLRHSQAAACSSHRPSASLKCSRNFPDTLFFVFRFWFDGTIASRAFLAAFAITTHEVGSEARSRSDEQGRRTCESEGLAIATSTRPAPGGSESGVKKCDERSRRLRRHLRYLRSFFLIRSIPKPSRKQFPKKSVPGFGRHLLPGGEVSVTPAKGVCVC